jgi:hypothetical protein
MTPFGGRSKIAELVLVHTAGERIAEEWPICGITGTAPRTALTRCYARTSALFPVHVPDRVRFVKDSGTGKAAVFAKRSQFWDRITPPLFGARVVSCKNLGAVAPVLSPLAGGFEFIDEH